MAKSSKTKIEVVIEQYSEKHQDSVNRYIQWFCIPFLTFGLLAIVWAIPFPYLAFLGKYNGFVNWASFLIAFAVYYYYRLSPLLSYVLLLVVFAFSAGIVGLEKLEKFSGGPSLWLAGLVIFQVGLIMNFLGYRRERRETFVSSLIQSILNGPLWLSSRLFKKIT